MSVSKKVVVSSKKVAAKVSAKADEKFVDDWKSFWRWSSVRFSMVMGILITLVTTSPDTASQILEMVPEAARVPLGFFFATVLPIYLRVSKGAEALADAQ